MTFEWSSWILESAELRPAFPSDLAWATKSRIAHRKANLVQQLTDECQWRPWNTVDLVQVFQLQQHRRRDHYFVILDCFYCFRGELWNLPSHSHTTTYASK